MSAGVTPARETAFRLRPARAEDAPRLREVAAASKRHWGYDPDRVAVWAEGLDLVRGEPSTEVIVAEVDGRVVGFSVVVADPAVCVLDELWIDPPAMGRGVGTLLFGRAVDRARELGARRLEWESEPNAVGFYEKVGARHTGETRLSSWGRHLSLMTVDLA